MKKYIIALLVIGFMGTTNQVFAFTTSTDTGATIEVKSEPVKVDAQAQTSTTTDTKTTPDLTGSQEQRVLPTVNKKTIDAAITAKITVRGWDPQKKEDIQGKIATELENNPEITSADVAEDSVTVNYKTDAKLFGFLPISMPLVISSNTEGKVKVKFPWYRFMVKTEFAKAQEKLDYVFQNNQTNLEFLRTTGSAEAQVEIFLTISKTMHDMSKSIIQNIKA